MLHGLRAIKCNILVMLLQIHFFIKKYTHTQMTREVENRVVFMMEICCGFVKHMTLSSLSLLALKNAHDQRQVFYYHLHLRVLKLSSLLVIQSFVLKGPFSEVTIMTAHWHRVIWRKFTWGTACKGDNSGDWCGAMHPRTAEWCQFSLFNIEVWPGRGNGRGNGGSEKSDNPTSCPAPARSYGSQLQSPQNSLSMWIPEQGKEWTRSGLS